MGRPVIPLVCVTAFMVMACGGAPTSPSSGALFPSGGLRPGPYTLALSTGAAPAAGPSASTLLCIIVGGGAPTSAAVRLYLVVEGSGGRASADDGDLVLALRTVAFALV